MDATSSAATQALPPNARRAWRLPRAILVTTGLAPLVAFVAFLGGGFLAIPPVAAFVTVLAVLAVANVVVVNRWTQLAAGILGLLFAVADMGPGGDPYAFRPDLGWLHFVSVIVMVCGVAGLAAGIAGFVRAKRGAASPATARWGVLALGLALGIIAASAYGQALLAAHPSVTQGAVVETAPDATLALTLQLDAFSPATLNVGAGQLVKLTITNRDSSLHNFHVDGSSVVTEIPSGKSVDVYVKLDAPGDHAFFCSLHPNMKGTFRVA